MNFDAPWNLQAFGDSLDINCRIYLDSKNYRQRFSQYGAGSMLLIILYQLNYLSCSVKYRIRHGKNSPFRIFLHADRKRGRKIEQKNCMKCTPCKQLPVQSQVQKHQKFCVVLVSLELALKIFHSFFYCLYRCLLACLFLLGYKSN